MSTMKMWSLGQYILLALGVLIVTLAVAALVDVFGSQGLHDSIRGLADVFTIVLTIATVLGLAIAVYAGLVAKEQVDASTNIARNDLALRIDARFREDKEHMGVYKALLNRSPDYPAGDYPTSPDWHDVRNYMQVFARIGRMLADRVFDEDMVVEYYGTRLRQLKANDKIAQRIRDDKAPPWPQVRSLLTAVGPRLAAMAEPHTAERSQQRSQQQ